MRRHLELLNAFLALRFKQPGYPSCLSDGEQYLERKGAKQGVQLTMFDET
jgi:hypothetical protein